MLIAVVISLSALLVNGQFQQNVYRKNRQLDLGLQDIEKAPSAEDTKQDDLRSNGFVPPLSNTYLPAKFDSEQSQQSFDTANANGKQKELCKAPFDSDLCKSNGNVEKPSQDLVPPFNSLEEGEQNKVKSAAGKTQSEETQTTALPTTEQEPEVTTVKAAEPTQSTAAAESSSAATSAASSAAPSAASSAASSAAPSAVTTTPSSTEITTTEKVVDKAEASSDQQKSVPSFDREYLPPAQEISAAAQTNIAVIQPINQVDNHDHHHGHHHDENFNICADAFHSFLCAPLKTRRRITGALPDKFKGSNSFFQYQKASPFFENQGASSNAVQNGYLPPKTNGFPANQIQTTYSAFPTKEAPTTTTPQPYSQYNTYTTSRPFSQYNTYTTSKPFSQYNTYTTSRPFSQYNTYTTSRPYSQFNTYTTSKPFYSQTSNTYNPGFTGSNPAYFSSSSNQVFGSRLPTTPTSTIKGIDNTYVQGSFVNQQSTYKTVNPSFQGISTYKPFSPNENRYYLPPDPKIPSASFAQPVQNYYQSSTSSRPQTSTFGSQETFLPAKYNYNNQKPAPTYQPFGSFNTVTSSPAYQTFGSFNTGTSSVRPTYTSPFATSYKPFQQGVYSTNQPKYQPGSNYISTTVKPFTTTKASYNFNQDKFYLPPDTKEPAAAQVSSSAVAAPQNNNPFHHGRDLCTDPFHSFLCTGPKPRKKITGALPPAFNGDSTKTNEQRAPAASNQNENVLRTEKPVEGAQAQNVGYKYPLPSNPLPTVAPTQPPFSGSTGYSYPKPEKAFPLPTQKEETKVVTKEKEAPTTTESKITKPVTGYETKPVNGYETKPGNGYETKPGNGYETKPVKGYETKPGNGYETKPGNGYETKPVKGYETKPVNGYEAKPVNGYETKPEPQPDKTSDQSIKVSTTIAPTTGYSYQRPQKTFPLPTDQKEIRQRPVESTTYRQPGSSIPGRGKGYQYSKPDQSFRLPEKKGYSYPKPDKRFELPTEGRRKSLPSQSNSNLDPVRNLGSADFIPVNKVDFKRSRPTNVLAAGLRRFGERLKIQDKRA